MNQLIIFFIIIFLLILIGIYYWFITPDVIVKTNNENKIIKNEVKMCTLSNFSSGKIETRVINVVVNNGEIYFYSNKNTYHVEQLKEDNRVSILMYTKDGNLHKQVLIYGYCEPIKMLDDLILYKVISENRKVSVTYDEKEIQVTNYSYNNKNGKEIRTNYKEVSELIQYVKQD